MTANEIAALKAELLAELRAEQERKARDKTMFQELMNKYAGALKQITGEGKGYWNTRAAMGAMLRMLYGESRVERLPHERKGEIDRFIADVMALLTREREEIERRGA